MKEMGVKNELGDSRGEADGGPVLEITVDDWGRKEEVIGCRQWR
jgi:hypothetical protein